ncbi:hypothetical protein AOLI_G00147780 [Acnodon oligacanthus]
MLVEVKGPNLAPIKQCQYPSKAHLYLKATRTQLTWVKIPQGWVNSATVFHRCLSNGGRIPGPCGVEMVKNLPLHQSVTALRSWLGLVGFCRDFIENFSDLAKPPYCMLKEKPAEKDSIVHMEVSLAAFALQLKEWNELLRPMAYTSRLMSAVEIAYDSCTRHLLAVHWAVQHFTHVTGFCKIIIHTPHTPIQLLLNGHVTGVHQKPGASELLDGNRRAE